MQRRPVIGLTGGRIGGADIVDNLAVLGASPVDVFYADYARAVLAAGGRPVYVPLDAAPTDYVDLLDGFLLTGGNDIDPARYNARQQPETVAIDDVRDTHELDTLGELERLGVPTLGICRGLQLINVHFGGTLLQHVPEHVKHDGPPHRPRHRVTTSEHSMLRSIYGEHRDVNSLHHQAVDRLASSLRATAVTADDGVEGIEHESLPIVAVQWHPEMMQTAEHDPLFAWLVDAARRHETGSTTDA